MPKKNSNTPALTTSSESPSPSLNPNKSINIAMSCDDNIAQYIPVVMISAYENHPDYEVVFYIMQSKISFKNLSLIEFTAKKYNSKVNIISVDESIFDRFRSTNRYGKECYYYFYAHKLLPKNVDRCIYLDVDVILNGDISEMYFSDFEENYLISTATHYNDEKLNEKLSFYSYEHLNSINIPDGELFCSGVMVLNLKKMRKDEIEKTYTIILDKIEQEKLAPYFFDQGLANYIFYTHTKFLPRGIWQWTVTDFYNFIFNQQEISNPKNAKIIHYINNYKPWTMLYKEISFETAPLNWDYFENPFVFRTLLKNIMLQYWWKYAEKAPNYDELILHATPILKELHKFDNESIDYEFYFTKKKDEINKKEQKLFFIDEIKPNLYLPLFQVSLPKDTWNNFTLIANFVYLANNKPNFYDTLCFSCFYNGNLELKVVQSQLEKSSPFFLNSLFYTISNNEIVFLISNVERNSMLHYNVEKLLIRNKEDKQLYPVFFDTGNISKINARSLDSVFSVK
ncbi:MAG: glycosyltransferase family 8 protein [Oscillospiraceae bacterium]|jgi:lipopolysaccharide biosynthesis glycosyltransferase|nr:glycosyltransferase family 8 protein [Oscillospiraceae bacterium]